MKLKEIYENLCYYDKRSPDFDLENLGEIEKTAEERKHCYCDNCFSGRDLLARELLKYIKE